MTDVPLFVIASIGWGICGFLLCHLTMGRSAIAKTPSQRVSSKQVDEGFMVLNLKEIEHLLGQAQASRQAMQDSHAEMKQLIAEDPLTGCHNRRAMNDQVEPLWQDHVTHEKDLSCLMFDIDHFKKFNDDHGHATGDEVLRRVGQTLRSTFAGVGHVYRYGGEEFCVLLTGHDLNEARWIAERVRLTIENIQVISDTDGQSLRVTASIGATDCKQGADSFEAMISQADRCLYMAKRKGRNCVIVHDEEVANAQFRS